MNAFFDRHRVLFVLAVLCWVVVARAPFLSRMGEDAAFFAVTGARWLNGAPPYAASFDVKPPLMFALFAAIERVATVTPLLVALVLDCFVAVITLALAHIVAARISLAAALYVAVLTPIYSITLMGDTRTDALAMLAALTLAFALITTFAKTIGRAATAGLLVGLAAMIRQSVVIEGAGFMVILALEGERRGGRLAAFAAGAALPAAVIAGAFAAAGQFNLLFTDVVLLALRRTSDGAASALPDSDGVMTALTRAIFLIEPLAGLLGAAASALRLVTRNPAIPPATRHLMIAAIIWLAAATLEIAVLHGQYPYYFLSLVPALMLLAAPLFEKATAPASLRPALIGLLLAAVPLAYDWRQISGLDPSTAPDLVAANGAADEIRHLDYRPGDHVLAVSRNIETLVALGADPGTPYYHPLHLLCRFPSPVDDPLAVALASQPRFITVSREDLAAPCELAARHRELNAALALNYRLAGEATGRWDTIRIYRHN